MKFVDEARICVEAGNGGPGCMSFRREKFVPRGGPDGGDGGDGASVYLVGRAGLNTLADFRHTRRFRATDGGKGGGRRCTGRSGADLVIAVPLGTVVRDALTREPIGEITGDGERLAIAHGGRGGLGNAHFKSSTNRSPRRTTPGTPGESRELELELQVLADVGLLGLPNAGKSTLLCAVSQARPKVADYPFTTLYPQLGVVHPQPHRRFVVADIPGLIEGAAAGAGLGHRFLRHLARTRLLLHVVDLAPLEPGADPVAGARAVVSELRKFSPALARRERWLVFNKIDRIPAPERAERIETLRRRLRWAGRVFAIAAIDGEGCRELSAALMIRLDELVPAKNSRPHGSLSDD